MQTTTTDYNFLRGGGKMGELTRNYDWSQTALGTPAQWPQSLRTTLSIILNSQFPMLLFWGKELLCFYNDAYRPSLGNSGKHPFALGKPAAGVWQEIWPDMKPLIDQVLSGGETVRSENLLLPVYRNGQMEDVCWNYNYSPVSDETGNVAGVFITCTETTEAIQTNTALQESRDRMEFIIESAELGTWEYNPLANKLSVNERVKEWFSLPSSAEIDLEVAANAIAPEDLERVKGLLHHALQYHSGGKYDAEYTIIHPATQQRRIIRAQGKAHFNEQKIAYRLSGILQDITEQAANRKAIEVSEQRFRSLIEEAPVAICLFTGRELIIEIANPPMLQFFGKGSTVLKKPLAEALPELKDQAFLQILDDVYTSGKDYKGKTEFARLLTDGIPKDYYFNYHNRPLFNDAGEVYGIMSMAVDVTEQVLAKQKTEEAEERTRLAVEAGELGTYELDILTNTVIFSKRYEEIFDVHDTNQRNRFVSAIHPDDQVIREMARVEAYKTGVLDYKFRVIKQSGNIHWIRAKGKVYFDAAKTPVRILGTVQDITEQVELERQKDSFLGIASHELKTPVTSIKGYAQIMERRFKAAGDTKNAEMAAKMDKQASRLTSLIGDLLDVTKINHGRLQFHNSTFDFNDMVEEVIEDMQRISVNHTIQKKLQTTASITGDRERICQVLVNLITNAIKYSPDSSRIIVYTESHESEVQLCVQDFGIGITREKQDQVFEQFYRVSGTKEHTFPGLGLGLYISSEIIKRMNGRIWVNSTEGKGSTFCFAIPVQQQ